MLLKPLLSHFWYNQQIFSSDLFEDVRFFYGRVQMKRMRFIPFNMMSAMLLAVSMLLTACSGGGGGGSSAPKTFTISGTVASAETNVSVENAQVSIVNAETRQNALDPVYTDGSGTYLFDVPVDGVYEVRVSAQGYMSSPLDGVVGVPISETTTYDVKLEPINDGGTYGWLNLNLVDYVNTHGALVILTSKTTSENYTGVTSVDGQLMMYNLPDADYNLTIRSIGHEIYSSESNVTITADMQAGIDYIGLTAIDGFNVSGTVTFLAVENAEVDVSLTDPETGDVIPGTNVYTLNTDYTIGSVAPGDYIIRATYKIDGYVVDPDSIVKHGEPEVTVADIDMQQNIDVTGAVALVSPVAASLGVPVEVSTLTPTFEWTPYPSSSDYVVEVVDANGNVIWGGFDENLTKLVTTAGTSIEYSNDGQGQALQTGAIYRWKVYASKDDVKEATGWKLISASEEAQGVFRVVEPQ